MTELTEVDYLIVGAGAMGMAFADALLTESQATLAMIDRLDKPGGHWNHAYPFVRLHQPSNYYGVNSRPLGEDRIDAAGRNKGMLELASAAEILAYFDGVMRRDFLPTGRVAYYPQTEFLGDEPDGAEGGRRARARRIASGEIREIRAKTIVDASYMNVQVPQATPPRFEVAPGAECAPPNRLAALGRTYERYVVIGAGKTAFDSLLYLMDLGVSADRITWIAPRGSWLIDRAKMQPEGFGEAGFGGVSLLDNLLEQVQAIALSTSEADMFARLEACEGLIRIDQTRMPSMFRCATVSHAELADLRRITDVVRLGRVRRLEPGRVILEEGEIAAPEESLFVNCTADGLERRAPRPIFAGSRITLQAVRPCQQLFGAAMIGHVECAYSDETKKNALCAPTPHPDTPRDYLAMMRDVFRAQLLWSSEPALLEWLVKARLDALTTPGFAALQAGQGPVPAALVMETVATALAKLEAYLAEPGPSGA